MNSSSKSNILKWNISNVNDISGIFYECSSLKSLPDISNWDTSNVIDMEFSFFKCIIFQIGIQEKL